MIATPTGNAFLTFEIIDIAPIAVAKNMRVLAHRYLKKTNADTLRETAYL